QLAPFSLYLSSAASTRLANRGFHALSIRGSLTVTSKQQFSRFIYSRRPHRDKQTVVFALYLFAAASPRQANSSFRALSIRGSLIATSNRVFSRHIRSRQRPRETQTAVFEVDPSVVVTANTPESRR